MKWTNPGHEFDKIGERFQGVEEIIIYGTGEYGTRLGTLLAGIKAPHVYVDNYRNLNGTYMKSRVISHAELAEEMKRKKCIIVLSMGGDNIGNILKKLEMNGLQYGREVYDFHTFIYYYIYIYAAYNLNKCLILDGSVIGVYKCSLRCKHCMGAFPYMGGRKDRPVSEVKQDVDILFSSIDYIQEFGIAAGDMFLYDGFEEFTSYVMDRYANQIGNCLILVNGMITPRQSILDTIKKYGLSVKISNYKDLKNWKNCHDKLVKVLQENGIEAIDVPMETWVDMGWTEKQYREYSRELFDSCTMQCRTILDGRLYYCTHALTANQALYGLPIEEEWLDLTIERENKKKIIMEYLLGYQKNSALEMCHYCNGSLNINQHIIPAAIQL